MMEKSYKSCLKPPTSKIYLGCIPQICLLSDLKFGLRSHLRPDAAQRGQIREILVVLVLTRAALVYRKSPMKIMEFQLGELRSFWWVFVTSWIFTTFSWFSGILVDDFYIAASGTSHCCVEFSTRYIWQKLKTTRLDGAESWWRPFGIFAAVLMAFNNDKPHMMQSLSGWWLSHNSEKNEFVSWDDSSQYMEKLKKVSNHQPVIVLCPEIRWIKQHWNLSTCLDFNPTNQQNPWKKHWENSEKHQEKHDAFRFSPEISMIFLPFPPPSHPSIPSHHPSIPRLRSRELHQLPQLVPAQRHLPPGAQQLHRDARRLRRIRRDLGDQGALAVVLHRLERSGVWTPRWGEKWCLGSSKLVEKMKSEVLGVFKAVEKMMIVFFGKGPSDHENIVQ